MSCSIAFLKNATGSQMGYKIRGCGGEKFNEMDK